MMTKQEEEELVLGKAEWKKQLLIVLNQASNMIKSITLLPHNYPILLRYIKII